MSAILRLSVRARRCWLLLAVALAGLPLVYFTVSLVLTVFPANADWRESATGIEVYVTSNGTHADIIVPLHGPTWDWRRRIPSSAFRLPLDSATHLAFGWGDRRFFLETPTWSDLTARNVVRALFWPSASVMHVRLLSTPESLPEAHRLVLEPEQFGRLDAFIVSSFTHDGAGRVLPIAAAHYSRADAFFEGVGAYTLFYTCNNWVGAALNQAGVTVGRWTPFEFNLRYHLRPD